jgi:hypothetical protein
VPVSEGEAHGNASGNASLHLAASLPEHKAVNTDWGENMKRHNSAHVGLLVAVGLLMLGGGMAESAAAPVPGAAGPPAVGRGRAPASQPRSSGQQTWRPFGSKPGLFAAEFPGRPTRSVKDGTVMFTLEVGGVAYLACYTDLPADHGTPKEMLDGSQEKGFDEGSKLLKSQDKPLEDKHAGRAVVVQDAEGDLFVARFYVVKDRMYQVMCVLPGARKDSPDVTRFLDSFKLLDPAKIQAETPKKPSTAEPGAEATTKAADPTPPPGADDLTAALAGLKLAERGKVKAAAEQLAKMEPVKERRDEVAKALASALGNENGFARASALKALAVWYVPAVLPDMVQRLQDESGLVCGYAFDALAAVKSPAAAEAVAARLADDRGHAAKALKAMGPLAEPAALKCLKHADPKARVEAIKVLGEIGTAKSLPALKPLVTDKDLSTRASAERAVKAIEGRR